MFVSARTMTSPPRPPSPPSGPPMGTNFSRRNELAPDPPVPASTFTTTRSMNISGPLRTQHAAISLSLHPRPELPVATALVGREHVGDRLQRLVHVRA